MATCRGPLPPLSAHDVGRVIKWGYPFRLQLHPPPIFSSRTNAGVHQTPFLSTGWAPRMRAKENGGSGAFSATLFPAVLPPSLFASQRRCPGQSALAVAPVATSFLSLPRGEDDADFGLPSGQGDLRGSLSICYPANSLRDPLVHLQRPRQPLHLNTDQAVVG